MMNIDDFCKMNEVDLRWHYIHEELKAVMSFEPMRMEAEAMRMEVYSISKKSCPILNKYTLTV